MINFIKTGNKINIMSLEIGGEETSPGPSGWNEAYVSQVEDVLNKNEVAAAVPITGGKLVRLPVGMRYNFVFHTLKGMISFIGRIESYYQEAEIYLMKIKLVSNGELIQRREFFRFECRLNFSYSVLDDNDEIKQEPSTGGVIDLSGGGLRFVTDDDLAPGTRLRCSMDLGSDLIILIGKVINQDIARDFPYKFQYRVMFAGILKADQEKIVKYIFNEQRRQLKALR